MDNAANIRYPSLTALQAAHNGLLKRQRREADASAFLSQVTAFLSEGAATGALLDADADRRAAQGLLDYWVARLYRVGAEPPDATLAEFDPAVAPELPDNLCPYLGLDAFRETDSDKFFGRAELIARLVERLANQRLLAVVGPSGSGKSSLVRAGLVPVLKHDALPGSKDWSYLPPIVPGSDPLAALQRVLSDKQTSRQADDVYAQPSLPVSSSLNLLVIDQFEELFTLCDDDQARQAFVAALREWIDTPEAENRLILTMRSDFETFVARAPDLQARFNQGRVQVTPLSAAELREAIEHPAEAAGLKFQAGIVEALLQDILGEPAGLPLLQFTLLKLWEHRDHNRVTREIYDHVGGGRLALARCADEFYDSLIPEERVTARRILLRMIRPGEGLEITSSRIRREDLYRSGEDPGRIDRVLAKLIDTRLVRLTEGKTREDTQVEVAHEALVRNWPTLVDWLEQEKAALAIRRRLEGRAIEWVRLGQGSGGLLDEVELREAERWLASTEAQYLGYDTALPALVEQSRAAIAQAEREKEAIREADLRQELRTTSLRRWLVILLFVTVIAIGLSLYALQQRQSALQNANVAATAQAQAQTQVHIVETAQAQAQRQATLAQTAEAQAQKAVGQEASTRAAAQLQSYAGESLFALNLGNIDRALLLARASVPTDNQTAPALLAYARRRAFEATVRSIALIGHHNWVIGGAWSPNSQQVVTGSDDGTARIWDSATGKQTRVLTGHTGEVRAAAWSPDGRFVLTGSADMTARIWDNMTGSLVRVLTGHIGEVRAVAWSPDGRFILTGSADKTAGIWDVATGNLLQQLKGHSGEILAVAWAPDGNQVITGSSDQTAHLWDVATGQTIGILRGHTTWVFGVAWSPDGQEVVTGSGDQTVRIWLVATKQQIGTLIGHAGGVLTVAWSPDGRQILTGSDDRTARLWDAATGQQVQILAGHSGWVWAAAWSHDGRQVLTGSSDHTARVWAVAAGEPVRTMIDAGGKIWTAAWSPDGQHILTGGDSQTARLWDAKTGKLAQTLTGHKNIVRAVAWSPNAHQIFAGSDDGTAYLWDITTDKIVWTLSKLAGTLQAAVWSPDGKQILTSNSDNTARLWDASTGDLLRTFDGRARKILAVAWRPDSRQLLIGSEDGTARLWDASTGDLLRTFDSHAGQALAAAWSPNGRQLLIGSGDGTAQIWDAKTGDLLQTLRGHAGSILAVAWSPDGRQILTGSIDRTARIWDGATGTLEQSLEGHTAEIRAVAWSPDGRQVLTASFDGTARLWVVDNQLITAEITRRICNLFTDQDIRKEIPAWHGCTNELAAVKDELKEYDLLRGEY